MSSGAVAADMNPMRVSAIARDVLHDPCGRAKAILERLEAEPLVGGTQRISDRHVDCRKGDDGRRVEGHPLLITVRPASAVNVDKDREILEVRALGQIDVETLYRIRTIRDVERASSCHRGEP